MYSNTLPVAEDIFDVISYIGQQDAVIELTKSFKGLVLRQDIRVLEVNSEQAVFQITSLGMSAALEGEVYLHSQSLPKSVKAHIKSLDIRNCRLVLTDFAYIDIEMKRRKYERVRPKKPTYVTLHWKGIAHRACMENISANGMGILAFKIIEKGVKIQAGSKVQLEFQLSSGLIHMAVNGTIIYINPIDSDLTRIGIHLYPAARESRLIKEYIAPRKQEILQELNQAYWELTKPRGVESLYF